MFDDRSHFGPTSFSLFEKILVSAAPYSEISLRTRRVPKGGGNRKAKLWYERLRQIVSKTFAEYWGWPGMRISSLTATVCVALGLSFPASASGWDDWSLSPLSGDLANLNYSVGGQVYGSAFAADQPGAPGLRMSGATGAATLSARLQRDYDSGLSLALKGSFEIYHDHLSGDNYGSAFVQKIYGSAQTGLGRIDVGMTDGAAYALSITGPVVNPEVTIDNSNTTFFRDPSTGGAFINVFALSSAVESSLNYAKVSYYTPRLFGLQLAASFTPSEGKDVIPFLNGGPHVANRQTNMWEAAVSYSDNFGAFTLGVYGGLVAGHNNAKTFGHKGLTDWGFGTQLDWDVNDDVKWSIGGAFRQSNAYVFAINNAFAAGNTQSMHLSTTVTYGSWIAGAEFGNGTADGLLGAPTIGTHAYLIDVGYVINSNLQLTAGWQKLNYNRSSGAFYNGAPRIEMDAEFLHAVLNI